MDDMDEIMKEYTSRSDVQSAMEEKAAGEFVEEELAGEAVKDYPSVQREIDLHNKTGNEAKMDIKRFVDSCHHQNIKTVRVITGKGTGVVLRATEQLLSSLRKDRRILTFQKEKTGGSFIVYL